MGVKTALFVLISEEYFLNVVVKKAFFVLYYERLFESGYKNSFFQPNR